MSVEHYPTPTLLFNVSSLIAAYRRRSIKRTVQHTRVNERVRALMPYPGTSPNHRNANSRDYESQLQTVLFNVWRSRLRHPVAAGTIATLVPRQPTCLTGDLTIWTCRGSLRTPAGAHCRPVAEGQKDHYRIPMPIAIVLDGLDRSTSALGSYSRDGIRAALAYGPGEL